MKRIIAMLLTVILCLCLAGCGKTPESEQSPQETHTETTDTEEEKPQSGSASPSGNTAGQPEEPARQSMELVGPWYLDSEKNDLAAFADSLDRFPGYGEWGASMEIRSNGQMGWYIGAESWHGTYTVEDGVIHAQLTSDLEQSTQNWDFRITEENGAAILEMDDQDMTIYWAYGDREDVPAMGVPSKVYVDRQGTDEIYSSLTMEQSDTGYVVEMEIYRLDYFRGTAVDEDGMLVYTDDLVDMKGTTGALNQSAAQEVMAECIRLNREGTTILMVTHDSKVAARCGRILYLLDGCIKGEFSPAGAVGEREREVTVSRWLAEMGW